MSAKTKIATATKVRLNSMYGKLGGKAIATATKVRLNSMHGKLGGKASAASKSAAKKKRIVQVEAAEALEAMDRAIVEEARRSSPKTFPAPMPRDVIVAEAHRIFDRMRDSSLDRLATGRGWTAFSKPQLWCGDPLRLSLACLDLSVGPAIAAAQRAVAALDSASVSSSAAERSAQDRALAELEGEVCLLAHNLAAVVVAARHLHRHRSTGIALVSAKAEVAQAKALPKAQPKAQGESATERAAMAVAMGVGARGKW